MSRLSLFAIMATMLFICNTVRAERTMFLQNGQKGALAIVEVTGVPENLSVEQVESLVTGKTQKEIIKDRNKKFNFFFAFPLPKVKIEYIDKVVKYRDGVWLVNPAPSRFVESIDYFSIGIWLLIAFSILIATASQIGNEFSSKERSSMLLLEFYAAMFVVVLFVVVLVGVLVNAFSANVHACVVISMLIGMTVCSFAGNSKLDDAFIRMIGGMSAGVSGGLYAGSHSYEILIYFCTFLLIVEAVSFGIYYKLKK